MRKRRQLFSKLSSSLKLRKLHSQFERDVVAVAVALVVVVVEVIVVVVGIIVVVATLGDNVVVVVVVVVAGFLVVVDSDAPKWPAKITTIKTNC